MWHPCTCLLLSSADSACIFRTGDTYRNILNVNVVGTFLVTRAFIPLLKKKPSRTIVNISSGLGSISQNRLAFTAPNKNPVGKLWIAYNASKAGLNMRESID